MPSKLGRDFLARTENTKTEDKTDKGLSDTQIIEGFYHFYFSREGKIKSSNAIMTFHAKHKSSQDF